MEDRITAWFFGGTGSPTPLLVSTTVAERFGLQNGSKITDETLYQQVIEENTNLSRAACNIQAGGDGECTVCSS